MNKLRYDVSLPVIIIKEGKSYVAYTPALDLSTAAKTFEQAKERFTEAVKIFFEEIVSKGTLDQVLSELGWEKQKNQFLPPTIVSHQTEEISIPLYTS